MPVTKRKVNRKPLKKRKRKVKKNKKGKLRPRRVYQTNTGRFYIILGGKRQYIARGEKDIVKVVRLLVNAFKEQHDKKKTRKKRKRKKRIMQSSIPIPDNLRSFASAYQANSNELRDIDHKKDEAEKKLLRTEKKIDRKLKQLEDAKGKLMLEYGNKGKPNKDGSIKKITAKQVRDERKKKGQPDLPKPNINAIVEDMNDDLRRKTAELDNLQVAIANMGQEYDAMEKELYKLDLMKGEAEEAFHRAREDVQKADRDRSIAEDKAKKSRKLGKNEERNRLRSQRERDLLAEAEKKWIKGIKFSDLRKYYKQVFGVQPRNPSKAGLIDKFEKEGKMGQLKEKYDWNEVYRSVVDKSIQREFPGVPRTQKPSEPDSDSHTSDAHHFHNLTPSQQRSLKKAVSVQKQRINDGVESSILQTSSDEGRAPSDGGKATKAPKLPVRRDLTFEEIVKDKTAEDFEKHIDAIIDDSELSSVSTNYTTDYTTDGTTTGSGKKRRNGGLTDIQINQMMKSRFPSYVGTFAADEMKEIPIKKKMCFIINTQDRRVGDGHWVAVYIDCVKDKAIEYYDPFGEEPSKKFMKGLKPMIEKLNCDTYMKFKINRIKDQRASSTDCGWHSVNFLINRLKGKAFPEVTGYSDYVKGKRDVKSLKKKFDYI